jgi:uncharacterized protein YndB with AHSA1/START domain
VNSPKRSCLVFAAMFFLATHLLAAQEVKTSTTRSSSGDTVVRVEAVVAQSPKEVWQFLSTEKGLQCWIAPVVRLDLRVGGKLETNYDAKAAIGAPGTIVLDVLNFVAAESLTLKVNLNDAFSEAVQAEDGKLQEVIRLERAADGGTRISSTMTGFGSGAEWDQTAAFFARGNEQSLNALVKCVAAKPAPAKN